MAHKNHPNRRQSRRGGSRIGRKNPRSFLKTLLLILMMVAIPALGLGGGGYYAYTELSKEKVDVAFCYERNDQYQAAVFVDFSHTHSGSDSQNRDLVNTLSRTFRNLPPNGKIAVFTTSRDNAASEPEPEFVLCHPAQNAREQERIGAPEKSDSVLKRESGQAKVQFSALLEDLVRDAKDPNKSAGTSPILEQIAGISRYDFSSPLSLLKIYSDGIQNSAVGRFCLEKGAMPKFSVFAQKPFYEFIKPNDLTGVDVEFLMVEFGPLPSGSMKFCTTDEKRRFWMDYARGNGAKNVRLTPLTFGAG